MQWPRLGMPSWDREDVMNFKVAALTVLLSLPALTLGAAEIKVGRVFDCQSTEAVRVWSHDDAIIKQKRQNFLVRVDKEELQFISNSSYVSGSSVIKNYHQPYFVTGYNDSTAFALERKDRRFRFHYSSTMSMSMFTMFGYCEWMQ